MPTLQKRFASRRARSAPAGPVPRCLDPELRALRHADLSGCALVGYVTWEALSLMLCPGRP